MPQCIGRRWAWNSRIFLGFIYKRQKNRQFCEKSLLILWEKICYNILTDNIQVFLYSEASEGIMYKIGEYVFHRSTGVCQVEDVREEKLTGAARLYYILRPMGDGGKSIIYIPVESSQKTIRPLISKTEVDDSIHRAFGEETKWIDNNNLRKSVFSEILKSDDVARQISLIVCLYKRKEKVHAAGKKFSVLDERILADAERKLEQEFSCVLGVSGKEVQQYIKSVYES